MPVLKLSEEAVAAQYPKIIVNDAVHAIDAGLGDIADQYGLDTQPSKAATAVYFGLLYLKQLKSAAGIGACRAECASALVALNNATGGTTGTNTSCFEAHLSFLKNRCNGLFPGIKAITRRCAALCYLGCIHRNEIEADLNDDWIKSFNFNS